MEIEIRSFRNSKRRLTQCGPNECGKEVVEGVQRVDDDDEGQLEEPGGRVPEDHGQALGGGFLLLLRFRGVPVTLVIGVRRRPPLMAPAAVIIVVIIIVAAVLLKWIARVVKVM